MYDIISEGIVQYEVARFAAPKELKLPQVLGLTEDAVKSMGLPAAIAGAQRLAQRTGKTVLVPRPGTGRSHVVKPRSGMPTAYQKKRPIVLMAQTRGPVPDAQNLPTGNRGPLPDSVLKQIAAKKGMREGMSSDLYSGLDDILQGGLRSRFTNVL